MQMSYTVKGYVWWRVRLIGILEIQLGLSVLDNY